MSLIINKPTWLKTGQRLETNTGWETAKGIWYQLETGKVRCIIEKTVKQNVIHVEKMTCRSSN